MAKKIRQPESKRLLERLIALFLRAETDIINEIARLRAKRLIDYHTVAALERVQAILNELQTESWKYVPKMIEQTFYERVPEAYRLLQPREKHQAGYYNARVLTSTQHAVVDVLVGNLMGEIVDACNTVDTTLRDAIIGPQQPGAIRNIALEISAGMQAGDPRAGLPAFVDRLRREGIRAFTDRAGRDWSLHTYGSMVLRTTNRQAEVMAVLTADDAHDLYQISSHGTTCKLCAPYEGRVYSKSGNDPDFPPLADAFGKVDTAGPDILSNTWLNIHPNCLHSVYPWTAAGRTPEEIQKIKDFSNPAKNPYSVDPRTQKQVEAYRAKEAARRRWLMDYRQFEKYRLTIPNAAPKTFATFQKHKQADDAKYREWKRLYREANRESDADID